MDELIDATGLYARLVSIQFLPENIDDAMEQFRAMSAPLVRRQPGSIAIIGAGNRVTGAVFALSFWESRDTLERSNANPDVIEALARYSEWMTGPFVVEGFVVVSGKMIASGSAVATGARIRIATATAVPDRIGEALEALQGRVDEICSMSGYCVGSLLLEPLVGHKVVAIEYWANEVTASASESRVNALDQRLSRSGVFQTPIRREVYGMTEAR